MGDVLPRSRILISLYRMKEKFMSDSSNEDSFYGDFAHHDRELPNEDTINEGFYYKID